MEFFRGHVHFFILMYLPLKCYEIYQNELFLQISFFFFFLLLSQ